MDLIHEKNEEYIVRETTIVERKKKLKLSLHSKQDHNMSNL